jgi:hypothetical protein
MPSGTLWNNIFAKFNRGAARKRRNPTVRRLRTENLEERRLLAIMWNAGTNNFASAYRTENGVIATQLVQRAVDDWNKVILDFNYDGDGNAATDNTYSLTVNAGAVIPSTSRGGTVVGPLTTTAQGRRPNLPISATITMDDNAASQGWFFDTTPSDDAEFTAIVNSGSNGMGVAFQASFVDVNTGMFGYHDFYRTITHEIGHAVGIFVGRGAAIDAFLTNAGDDQLSNDVSDVLRQFQNAGVTATFTTDGGGHLYEGPADPSFPNAPTHPNELMNPGRAVPADPETAPLETTRQFISDLDAQILSAAYGYTVILPSTLNTAHVTLDSLTGTLLVQGGVTSAGVAQTDSIVIDTVGIDIRVRLYNSGGINYATERVPAANVTQIVVSRSSDNISDPNSLLVSGVSAPVHHVYSVVSSNQDAIDTGSLSDGFIDLDMVVPGAQVTLRAAVQNSNGLVGGSVYLPRGRYRLTLAGSGQDAQGDLDIAKTFNLFGTGAGQSIIDAGGDTGILDRVFEVDGFGPLVALTLNSVTVTGGRAPNISSYESHGGGIFVRDGTTLHLNNSAVVDNKTTSDMGIGGGIFFAPPIGHTITNSVITANHSSTLYWGRVPLWNHVTAVLASDGQHHRGEHRGSAGWDRHRSISESNVYIRRQQSIG